ncbi:unnamed protein product [Strongylus vulgaris]|uniref:Uncharacterized protein n=1 Tax=Strongylus vulgaris TaxID=40348 RepID=A0A3P7L9P9_STRVU|nr:unnamed protein product [Strongylus vulgaris]
MLKRRNTPTTRNGDCFMLCTHDAKTVSNADLHALLEAAVRIDYHVSCREQSPGQEAAALIIRGENVTERWRR